MSAGNAMRGSLAAAFDAAWPHGLPPFGGAVERSNPLNATPYACSFAQLASRCATDPRRSNLLRAARGYIDRAEALGVEIVFAIVGGSFLDRDVAAPNDLDCIAFYVARSVAAPDELGARLGAIQIEAHHASVDLRFLPYDGEPWLTAKMIGYFCVLYSRTRADAAVSRGVVLAYPDRASDIG